MNPLHFDECDIKIVSHDELMKDIPDLDKLVGCKDEPGPPGPPLIPDKKRFWRR